MARFSTSDFDRLALDFTEMENLPDEILKGMAKAAGEVIRAEQGKTAREMLNGPYASGTTAAQIAAGTPKRTSSGVSVTIYPRGSRKRGKTSSTNAAIAFINEFGKRGQPARPFIRTANERAADEAVDAAAKVYDDYLKSTG